MNSPVISLCIPTNGIMEWVFPVLDSIYAQGVDPEKFEVIVADNGKNDEFRTRMTEYARSRENLTYRKTEAVMFHNQLETLKLARGMYLKFVNHRTALTKGALSRLISRVEENAEQKPVMYMTNGVKKAGCVCDSFDEFVRSLSRYASWTTGVGIWKSDYDSLPENLRVDPISPHSCILFAVRSGRKYIIDNDVYFRELDTDHSRKGSYDLFRAFGVEELSITQNLYIDGDITAKTLKSVKSDYGRFLSELYLEYCVLKRPCSYRLDGFNDAMGIYFSKWRVIAGAFLLVPGILVRKTTGALRRRTKA